MMSEGSGVAASRVEAADLAFQNALALRQRGDVLRADALCAAALEDNPRHFEAQHLRGLIALEQGDTLGGIDFIGRSLAINPEQPLAYSNIGNALLTLGQPQRALQCLDHALRLKSDLLIAHFNRGNALRDLGRTDDALASYDCVLRLDVAHAKALNNRGLVLQQLGRGDEALDAFAAAAIDSRFIAPAQNLSAALLKLGRAREALTVCDRWLAAAPADAAAHCTRGVALVALERPEEAMECFARALQADPQSVNALVNAGGVLLSMQRALAALACYDRALGLSGEDADAARGRAAALLQLDRREEAAQAFTELLRLQPDDPSALENLWHLRLEQCDWSKHEHLSSRVLDSLRRTRRFINPLTLLLSDDAALSLECARAFSAERYPPDDALGPCEMRIAGGGEKIRVAYVSADFGDHPVSHLLVGVLERHDRSRFEVIGVALRPRLGGSVEQRVHAAFDRSIDACNLSDRSVAEQMRAWGVDIAVDLMGFTQGSRQGIFAHRAAPVQASYLGYAGTLGAPYIDYLVADATVIPPGDDVWYSEQIVRLPECYLPADDRRTIAAAPTRLEAGLPPAAFVYCAFTKAHKIDPALFAIWMRLLHETPQSVLWLRDMGAAARDNLVREAGAASIEGNRVIFAPRIAAAADHLARFALADLFLDTRPYNAHSTVCEALWAGVPVLTCTGNGFASRVAASALAAAGLPELVTTSLDNYRRQALDLAQQPQRLQAIRARLSRSNRSALFDTARYVRCLESAYLQMRARSLEESATGT